MEIKFSELKKIINLILSKIELLGYDKIFVDRDLYWSINSEEMYNVYTTPNNLTIGSLSDDLEYLQNILEENREIINYDLYKLSCILHYVYNKNIIDNK